MTYEIIFSEADLFIGFGAFYGFILGMVFMISIFLMFEIGTATTKVKIFSDIIFDKEYRNEFKHYLRLIDEGKL